VTAALIVAAVTGALVVAGRRHIERMYRRFRRRA